MTLRVFEPLARVDEPEPQAQSPAAEPEAPAEPEDTWFFCDVINVDTTGRCQISGWSAALAGRRGLVVHPFRKTIVAQYARRAQLFPGKNVLPEFASLTVVQAVQGLGGQDTGYASWFDALAAMEREMDAADYDVAIVGAGAYGLPLAAHARDTGHAAIQMSGATQLLFGIKGKRWDSHPIIGKLYNDAWVRPDETEGITHKEKVEGGSYW